MSEQTPTSEPASPVASGTPDTNMAAHVADCREQGFPFCDTCDLPAVWSEFYGWMHSTPEHKFGVPKRLDESGHEVTAKNWWNDSPRWGDRRASGAEVSR